jgi:uncharacterized protein (DUF302 family)
MKTNIHIRSFSLLASLALAIAAFFSGPTFGSQIGGGALNLTPFTRVAVIGPISDPVEADATAKTVATAIATYVATVNDTLPPTEFPANWILGGLELEPGVEPPPEDIEEAILRVPTPYRIDPTEPMTADNRKKVNLVEMCNPLFAKKALGVLPIVEDDPTSKVINGYIHAPALPCEVAIYSDENGYVYVEMLNPEAIFTLFFTDVLFGEQMQDPDFAAEIQALPAQVNDEIKTIIYLALDGANYNYAPLSEPLGPKYKSLQQVAQVVAETPYQSPFVHFAYKKSDGSVFETDEVEFIADKIIETFTLDGIHPVSLDKRLNMDDWRSARPHPLPVPGNLVIEACSPTNAIAAMGLGMDHATALPCEIAVKAVSYDGVDGNETLLISYLDPHFMFSALFSDAFGDLSDEEMEAFLALPPLVLEDLQTIVKAALKRKNLKEIDIKLKKPQQLFFDMLPDDDDDDDDDKKKHHKRHHDDDDDHDDD